MFNVLGSQGMYLWFFASVMLSFFAILILLNGSFKKVYIWALLFAAVIPLPIFPSHGDSGVVFLPYFFILGASAWAILFGSSSSASILYLVITYPLSIVVGRVLVGLSDDKKRVLFRVVSIALVLTAVLAVGAWVRVRTAKPTARLDAFIKQEGVFSDQYFAFCSNPTIEKYSDTEVLPSRLIGDSKVHFGPTRRSTCLNGFVALNGANALSNCWYYQKAEPSCIATFAEFYDKTGAFCEGQELNKVLRLYYQDDLAKHVTQCRNALK